MLLKEEHNLTVSTNAQAKPDFVLTTCFDGNNGLCYNRE